MFNYSVFFFILLVDTYTNPGTFSTFVRLVFLERYRLSCVPTNIYGVL